MEVEAGAEGLGEVREVANMGRGGTQIGGNILLGVDTGGNTLWLGDLGTIGGDGEDGGGDAHQVSEKIHREAGAEEGIQDVDDYQDGISVIIVSKPFRNDLHRKNIGDIGTVGGFASNF